MHTSAKLYSFCLSPIPVSLANQNIWDIDWCVSCIYSTSPHPTPPHPTSPHLTSPDDDDDDDENDDENDDEEDDEDAAPISKTKSYNQN